MSAARPAITTSTLLPTVDRKQRKHGMSVLEAFRLAIQGLLANKLRSILTMLGIIIGVSSVIVMVALGQGVGDATKEQIKKLGTNAITVLPNSQMRGGVSQGLGSQQTLKLDDAETLLRLCPSAQAVAPESRGNGQVKYKNENTKTTVFGTTKPYFSIRNLPLAEGRYFDDDEVTRKAKVAVIGDSIRENLFGGEQCIGKTIKINGQNFLVIGLIQKRGGMMFRNPDDQVNIPVTTAMRRVFGLDYINSISVQGKSEDVMDKLQGEIYAAISKAHRLRADEDPDIRIFSQADLSESANAQSAFLTMLLAGIALVSLIVGGIGIMNIMLVSVTERTREIGIRKALGAKRRDILNQFLIESVTMSLVGGMIGVLFGIGISVLMGRPADEGGMGFPMSISLLWTSVAFASSAVVGIFFGIYPAFKASGLNPIEALRYE